MAPSARSVLVLIVVITCSTTHNYFQPVQSMRFNSMNHKDTVNVLLQFKNSLQDPAGSLSSWSTSFSSSPCDWNGMLCDRHNDDDDVVVVGLNLSNMGLSTVEELPAAICGSKGLANLTHIDLSFNVMQGPFPYPFLQCTQLQYLNLSENFYVDSLPSQIHDLQALQVLDLSYNNFSGTIPEGFGELPQLRVLNLYANRLNSSLPAHLGRLQNLQYLRLAYNPFSQGPIPEELGNLTNLQFMWLSGCNLIGSIPASLGMLVKLENLDLSYNELTGSIPSDIFDLPNLYQLELYQNRLEGSIADNIGNLTAIVNLDLSENELSGVLPSTIANLHKLESLHLNRNKLSGSLPYGIALLPGLKDLSLFSNNFSGIIPPYLGHSSKFRVFDVASNHFTGPLPQYLCDGGELEVLVSMDNMFTGSIPESYGNCSKVQRMRMGSNMLNGHVPEAVWGLPAMYILELRDNHLEGTIAPSIGNAIHLSTLRLQNNFLSGALPPEIGKLLNLSVELSLSHNHFTGPLPKEIGNLEHLNTLSLAFNFFSDEIPQEIASCKQLVTLDLSHNYFTGTIPASLGSLPIITLIDLSFNSLTGRIPPSLLSMASKSSCSFNVSYNNLSGEVPSAFNATCFIGNVGICSDNLLGVRDCRKPSRLLEAMLAGMFAMAFTFLLLGLLILNKLHGPFIFKGFYKSQKRDSWNLISFQKVTFNEEDILDSLDEDNVIGSGSAGKVYRTVLKNGDIVAVKKLWNSNKQCAENEHGYGQGNHGINLLDHGFKAEIATLGKIRHKNIVKLLCYCTGKDTKLLVYEYMPNGSLGDLLHGRGQNCKPGFFLDWESRYKIAVGAAQGLTYLHHDCWPPIVHRDIKSNNILLDTDMNAHVADFSVARVMSLENSQNPTPINRQSSSMEEHQVMQNTSMATAENPNTVRCNIIEGTNQLSDDHHNTVIAKSLQVESSVLIQSSCIAGSYGYIAPGKPLHLQEL
ncbi:hypothetical protein KP509_19G040800 [Ceratopteris richardii]|uniref:non-specific serine/threonine protein kinase n=1 Tax=Ceratopteris richardii TaxID=49495 RepID=A0A8T2SNU6_CERRI|nr:hypothetical protein KP509_19G040800 [Ceratopteris richardii]